MIRHLRSASLAIVLAAAVSASGFAKEMPLSDRLDRLFSELQSSQSELEARRLAGQIDDLWRGARGETARLLLSRADDAIADEDFALAIDVLDQLIAGAGVCGSLEPARDGVLPERKLRPISCRYCCDTGAGAAPLRSADRSWSDAGGPWRRQEGL